VAKTTLKLVLSLDPESQSYKPAGHNLSADQAIEQAQRLQGEGVTGVIVDQEHQHRPLSFHKCKMCRQAAEHTTNKRSQTADPEQPAQESGSLEQEESESE
jgi:hypothetical protein